MAARHCSNDEGVNCLKTVEDYPIEDMYGSEIRKGDIFYSFGESVVLESNLDDYITEHLKGEIHLAK